MRLTADQETMAAAVEDQWLAAALETSPANRPAAEEGVREAYRAAGLPEPEQIFWMGSPRAGAVAAALLAGAACPGDAPGWVLAIRDQLGSVSTAAPEPGVAGLSSGVAPGAGRSGSAARGVTAPGAGGSSAAGSGAGSSGADAARADAARSGRDVSVRRRVRTEPWAAARDRAFLELGTEGWAQLNAAAGRRGWGLAMERVAARLRLRLGEDLTAELPGDLGRAARSRLLDAIYGQHDGAWLSTFEAADRLHPGAALMTGLSGLAAVARNSGWWWAGSRFVVLTERPALLARDNVGRMHRGEGPAMEFPDGYGLWAWRGMPIPVELVAELPTLTVERIGEESNAELRRVMLEHFGYDRYLREAGAHALDQDETGTLWYLALSGDEPLVMVEVVNATPEPDGTSRIYWLRVPPATRTAREGVAWTFGLTADEYHPQIQT